MGTCHWCILAASYVKIVDDTKTLYCLAHKPADAVHICEDWPCTEPGEYDVEYSYYYRNTQHWGGKVVCKEHKGNYE